jgi:hypothetical protein
MHETGEERSEGPALEARVLQYGLLPPIQNGDLVAEQMRAARRYYNDHIALERARRDVFRKLRAEHTNIGEHEARCEALATELEELRTQIKAARARERRNVNTAELDARAKDVLRELRGARAVLKEARRAVRDDEKLKVAAAELEARTKVWGKALRATTKAYWGTYLLVEASIEQARKSVIDPQFRSARGTERISKTGEGCAEGRIGVQIQNGMTVQELLDGNDTRIRITPAPARFQRNRKSARGLRRCATKLLWLRIGSTPKRAPIWAVFPMILHRDIPTDALIKAASVHLQVIGFDEHWTVNLTYTRESTPMPQHEGVVALDLGWRQRPDTSLRAAYWVDHTGARGEILMSQALRARLRKTRDLQEIQDRLFNRVIERLKAWLNAYRARHLLTDDGIALPHYLDAIRPHLGQFRSHARLRRLVLKWRDNRFEGDERMFARMRWWLDRSRHLYSWQAHARENVLRARRETYRITAAQLARKYGTVVLEKFDLAKIKRLNEPEQGPDSPRAMRSQMHVSAPGELRQRIVDRVQQEGGLVVSLDAAGTTHSCHACGGSCAFDAQDELSHTCEHCGARWDQDYNAAMNLMQRYLQSGFQAEPRAKKVSMRAERFAKRHKVASPPQTQAG